jgi:ATP-dependent exoDNAse (exonuclease V) alpha subunit
MSLHTLTPPSDTPTANLAGTVERVTFHSEETGFCVLRVKVRGHRDLVTVVGTAPTITPGEYIESAGWWVTDRMHGLQFKTAQLRVVPPTTIEGIERYLGSGMVKSIGPHFARTLVEAFGAEVFDVIAQTPARLQELDGIGFKTADTLAQRLGIPRDAVITRPRRLRRGRPGAAPRRQGWGSATRLPWGWTRAAEWRRVGPTGGEGLGEERLGERWGTVRHNTFLHTRPAWNSTRNAKKPYIPRSSRSSRTM